MQRLHLLYDGLPLPRPIERPQFTLATTNKVKPKSTNKCFDFDIFTTPQIASISQSLSQPGFSVLNETEHLNPEYQSINESDELYIYHSSVLYDEPLVTA